MESPGDDRGYGLGPNAEAGPATPRSTRSTRSSQSRSTSRYGSRSLSSSASNASSMSAEGSASGSEYAASESEEERPSQSPAPSPSPEGKGKAKATENATDDSEDPPGLAWYISDLRRHMRLSEHALAGRVALKRDEPRYINTYAFSTVPPSNAVWTADEKAVLFASLARHSRYRPDLIAADVRTKSESLVAEYLAVLAWEAAHVSDRKGEGGESASWRAHLLTSGAVEADAEFAEQENRLAEVVEARALAAVPKERKTKRGDKVERVEYWGQDLGVDKLKTLASLLQAAEVRHTDDLKGIADGDEDDDENDDPLAKDHREIEALQSMPKQDRTPTQRRLLRTLLNRTASRERSRTKILVNLGFTIAQIDEAGGPDAMYASHLAGDKAKKKSGARRKSLAEVPEDSDIQQLAELGADAVMTERGWEVFNYARMSDLMNASGRVYEGLATAFADPVVKRETSPSPPPATDNPTLPTSTASFAVIRDVYTELLAYLKPLVYTSAIIAEQHAVQTGDPSITVQHVIAALGLRGELDPLREASQLEREERGLSRSRSVSVSRGVSSEPPGNGDLSTSPRHDKRQIRRPASASASIPATCRALSWSAATAAPLLEYNVNALEDTSSDELEGDDPFINGGESDIEDQELDTALASADECLDAVMAAQLAAAIRDDDETPVEEGMWARAAAGGRPPKRQLRTVGPELIAALEAAQEEYSAKMEQVFLARRSRALAANRARQFPRTRLTKRAAELMDSKPWKNSKRARVKAEPEGDVEYESEEGKMEVDDAGGENEVEEDEEEDENEEDEEDDEDDNEDENLDSEDDNRDDYDNDDNSDAAETVHDSETRSEASTRSVTRVSSPEQAQAQAQPAQSRPFKTSFWRVAEPSQQPSPAASERDELESSPPRDDLDSDSDDIKPVVSSLVQPEDVEMDSESDNDDVVNTQHTAGHLDWIVDATPLARSRSPSVRSDSFDD